MSGQGRGLVLGIGRCSRAVRSEGAEASGNLVFFGDAPDMAAAFALAVVMHQQPARWLQSFPCYRRDRAKAGEAAPCKFAGLVIAIHRHRLADIVIIPARSAVGKDRFGAGVVILARDDIAAGRAVKRIARPIGLEGDLARKAGHAAGGVIGDFLQQSLVFILSSKQLFNQKRISLPSSGGAVPGAKPSCSLPPTMRGD